MFDTELTKLNRKTKFSAVHELLAAPASSHAIGMQQRIELSRVLTKMLDERDDGSGLGVRSSPYSALLELSNTSTSQLSNTQIPIEY